MGGPIVSSSLLFVRGKNRVGQAAFLCGRYRDSRWQRERKEETQKAILLPFPIEFCFSSSSVDFSFFSRFFCFFFLLTAASLIVAYNLFSPLIRKERHKTNLDCFFLFSSGRGHLNWMFTYSRRRADPPISLPGSPFSLPSTLLEPRKYHFPKFQREGRKRVE